MNNIFGLIAVGFKERSAVEIAESLHNVRKCFKGAKLCDAKVNLVQTELYETMGMGDLGKETPAAAYWNDELRINISYRGISCYLNNILNESEFYIKIEKLYNQILDYLARSKFQPSGATLQASFPTKSNLVLDGNNDECEELSSYWVKIEDESGLALVKTNQITLINQIRERLINVTTRKSDYKEIDFSTVLHKMFNSFKKEGGFD